ncbi:MAG TPA: RNA polymerase sigma factor [Thermoanaerobaculia bacterium]|nr:RNA polymerase sigma factor [Thermoanaerobaculia bacterium]
MSLTLLRTIAVSVDEPRPSAAAPDGPSDEELMARARAGDAAAFGEFVLRHTPTVHRWMARAVGEQEADDLTQEVFLKAYRGIARFRGDAPPRAWIASIADNAVKNRYRSLGRFRRIFSPAEPEAGAGPAAGASPEESARAGESRRFVAEALKRVPVEFRLPVVLRDLEEWSYEEIAVSLRLPVGTVKSRIARGRGHLKAILLPLLKRGNVAS